MKNLNKYIVEKLKINNASLNNEDLINKIKTLMFDLNWYGPEYEISIDKGEKILHVVISFVISITPNDLKKTQENLLDKLLNNSKYTDIFKEYNEIHATIKKHNIIIITVSK